MRTSVNIETSEGVQSGFDYDRQCWIKNFIVQRCGHPESMDCNCFGKIHEGQDIRTI